MATKSAAAVIPPLCEAASKGDEATVSSLLATMTVEQVNQQVTEERGQSALHLACIAGHEGIVKLLIASGAQLDLPDTLSGATPLFLACWNNRLAVVKALLKHHHHRADAQIANKEGLTPFHGACKKNNVDVLKLLIQYAQVDVDIRTTDASASSGLHLAAAKGQKETVDFLVASKANVDLQRQQTGETALYLACSGAHKIGVVRSLLDGGANCDLAESTTGRTPLMLCAEQCRAELVTLLAERGANVNAVNKEGKTALMLCMKRPSSQATVKALLSKGAEYSEQMKPALIKLFKHQDLPAALGMRVDEAAANRALMQAVNDWTEEGGNDAMLAISDALSKGAKVNAFSSEGKTALHAAVESGKGKVVEMLITAGADVNRVTKMTKESALHFACFKGDKAIVNQLIAAGANLELQNINGHTPLNHSCVNGQLDSVKALLKAGAQVETTDARGSTPLHNACFKGLKKIAKRLIKSTLR